MNFNNCFSSSWWINVLLQNVSGKFDVHLTHGSGIKVKPIYKYEYKLSKTAIVSSIAPATVNVTGNTSSLLSIFFDNYFLVIVNKGFMSNTFYKLNRICQTFFRCLF
jgi:hypothetical protein